MDSIAHEFEIGGRWPLMDELGKHIKDIDRWRKQDSYSDDDMREINGFLDAIHPFQNASPKS